MKSCGVSGSGAGKREGTSPPARGEVGNVGLVASWKANGGL